DRHCGRRRGSHLRTALYGARRSVLPAGRAASPLRTRRSLGLSLQCVPETHRWPRVNRSLHAGRSRGIVVRSVRTVPRNEHLPASAPFQTFHLPAIVYDASRLPDVYTIRDGETHTADRAQPRTRRLGRPVVVDDLDEERGSDPIIDPKIFPLICGYL